MKASIPVIFPTEEALYVEGLTENCSEMWSHGT